MPLPPRCVLEVADCDPDYEGPLDDIDWSLCTLVLEKPQCANIRMVSDGDIVCDVPLRTTANRCQSPTVSADTEAVVTVPGAPHRYGVSPSESVCSTSPPDVPPASTLQKVL